MNGSEGEPQSADWFLGLRFPDDRSSFQAWECTRNLLLNDGFFIGTRRFILDSSYYLVIHGETPLSNFELGMIAMCTIAGEPVEIPEELREVLRTRRLANRDRTDGIVETHLIDRPHGET